jgi:hypothetical protein
MHGLKVTQFPFTQARTSILGALACAALMTGCKDARELVAPPSTDRTTSPGPLTPGAHPTNTSIAGFVIDKSDQCIIGARVEVIDGPRAGAAFVQTVCGFWDYGDDLGFSFHELPVGTPVTVRATANGYKPADTRAVPTNPYSYTTMIVLTKEQ